MELAVAKKMVDMYKSAQSKKGIMENFFPTKLYPHSGLSLTRAITGVDHQKSYDVFRINTVSGYFSQIPWKIIEVGFSHKKEAKKIKKYSL